MQKGNNTVRNAAERIAAVALDLGTTSIKAALLSQRGELCHVTSIPAPVIDTQNDCYESDALQYAQFAEQALRQCLSHTDVAPPLGLSTQRSSFLLWDRTSGQPVTPLISWQDGRGEHFCDTADDKVAALIPALTGLRLTPYYFAPKLSVLLRENPTWRKKLLQREWLAGTLDTFLIWRWTQGRDFCCDVSMAARTLLMAVHRGQWSDELCCLFAIPSAILPQIRPSSGLNLPLHNGLTLQASVGDQSAALYAGVTNDATTALVNLGTGGFVIRYLDADTQPLAGYLHTLVYQDRSNKTVMACEGTLNSIAAALAPYPFRDCAVNDLARNPIFCLAEPSGLGAPYFSSQFGLYFSASTAQLSQREITALLLEAIIFRVARILESFHRQAPLTQVYLSGGLSALLTLQHGIAQCAPVPVYYLQQKETSLQGAAMLAANAEAWPAPPTQRIAADQCPSALFQKYQDWKIWLDELTGLQDNP